MQNKKIFVLAGRSGSGKTSCLEKLIEKGYKKIVTVTTRPSRKEEVEGVNYFFVSKDSAKIDTDILFSTSIGDYEYGFKISELTKYNKAFITLNPKGIKDIEQLINPHNIHVILLDIPRELSIERVLKRGDNPNSLPNRLEHDDEMFSSETLSTLKSNLHILDGSLSSDIITDNIVELFQLTKNEH